MNNNDEIFVKIAKFDHFGNGVAKEDGYTIFVDGALPDDECLVRLYQVKKDYARAKIVSFKKKSASRIEPACPYYEKCGGCNMLHTSLENDFKLTTVCEVLNYPFKEILVGDNYYRNKASFHVRNGKIGFFKENTNEIVEVDECLNMHPLIMKNYQFIKEKMDLETLESVVIRVSFATNEVMLSFKSKDQLENIDYPKEVVSVYINDKHVYGKTYIYETLGNKRFQISNNSFFQVNTTMANVLYGKIKDYLKDYQDITLLDLYSGTGTIGLYLSDNVRKLIGIESEESAYQDALENAKVNNVHNAEFILGKVEDKIGDIGHVDVVVMDPPRNGSDPVTLEAVKKIDPERIIYVSCNPITLRRDLKVLDNYEILAGTLVNMFKNTNHVETVICLGKKQL